MTPPPQNNGVGFSPMRPYTRRSLLTSFAQCLGGERTTCAQIISPHVVVLLLLAPTCHSSLLNKPALKNGSRALERPVGPHRAYHPRPPFTREFMTQILRAGKRALAPLKIKSSRLPRCTLETYNRRHLARFSHGPRSLFARERFESGMQARHSY